MSLRDHLRLDPVDGFTLSSIDAGSTPESPAKKLAKKERKGPMADRLFDLHEMMMAGRE